MIEEKNEMVLDLLCGAGHGSFVISHYAHPESHVCVDLDYTLLFIAKKYFAPDAQFICLDANDPLPLKDRIFSSVIMMDSTHYVSNRNYLGKECQRVKENKGVLLWLHLHNALSKNPSEGYPLSPSRWADLMGDLSTIILPEEGIINQYMKERRLDLLADYPKTEIDSSSALCIMGAEDRHMMRTYENIDCPSLKTSNNMVINPMYDMRVQNGEIKLKRADLNEVYKSEYPLTFKYLPASYSLSRNFSHYLDGRRLRIPVEINRNDEKILEDLLKRFIILQVPEKYV
jgi:SAM-dependent methyltransferase